MLTFFFNVQHKGHAPWPHHINQIPMVPPSRLSPLRINQISIVPQSKLKLLAHKHTLSCQNTHTDDMYTHTSYIYTCTEYYTHLRKTDVHCISGRKRKRKSNQSNHCTIRLPWQPLHAFPPVPLTRCHFHKPQKQKQNSPHLPPSTNQQNQSNSNAKIWRSFKPLKMLAVARGSHLFYDDNECSKHQAFGSVLMDALNPVAMGCFFTSK